MANAKRAADDQARTGASTPVGLGRLRAIGAVAFTLQPIGHVPTAAKYATNCVLLLLLLAVLATAEHRQRAHSR